VNQSTLYQAVARATGEPIRVIRRLGFSLVSLAASGPPEEDEPASAAEQQGNDKPVQNATVA
jgi:hypothetical protein